MPLLNPTQQPIVTTADKIFTTLQSDIVEGNIAAGTKISEPELAKKYDVSRATLREALSRLEKCHLIEKNQTLALES